MPDLLATGGCRSLLEPLATETPFSTSAALKDTIKWYAYTPLNRHVPPQCRDTEMQSRDLATWDALRVASSPAADKFVKLQRERTSPIPPVSRLTQPSRLDVSARAHLDTHATHWHE